MHKFKYGYIPYSSGESLSTDTNTETLSGKFVPAGKVVAVPFGEELPPNADCVSVKELLKFGRCTEEDMQFAREDWYQEQWYGDREKG